MKKLSITKLFIFFMFVVITVASICVFIAEGIDRRDKEDMKRFDLMQQVPIKCYNFNLPDSPTHFFTFSVMVLPKSEYDTFYPNGKRYWDSLLSVSGLYHPSKPGNINTDYFFDTLITEKGYSFSPIIEFDQLHKCNRKQFIHVPGCTNYIPKWYAKDTIFQIGTRFICLHNI